MKRKTWADKHVARLQIGYEDETNAEKVVWVHGVATLFAVGE